MDERDERSEADALDIARALDAVAAREAGGAGEACALADGLDRADLELLGLLAAETSPVEPSPVLRARILDAVRAVAAAERLAVPEVASAAVRPGRPVRSMRTARWWLPLAAGVALAALVTAGWQSLRLGEQRARVAELERRLVEVQRRADGLEQARADLAVRSHELAAQLARVTRPGVEVCPLRPMAGPQVPPGAHALLFVSPADGVWYLRVRDLPPPPQGAVYVLWFLGEGGATTSAGAVRAAAEEGSALSGGALPGPHGMSRGVALTVESDPAAAAPSGPMLLFGDQLMNLS
jgi:Anti-sigma-K factor rskA, C-terminal